ncbi:hypothetical protein ACA910_008221 [Epithemia clementina (nom. ined.)]
MTPLNEAATSFDLSSTVEWERFYQHSSSSPYDKKSHEDDNNQDQSLAPLLSDMEWHSSIPMSRLLDLVPSLTTTTATTGDVAAIDIVERRRRKMVMIGCGTSNLPHHILNRFNNKKKNNSNTPAADDDIDASWQIILLDSSPTCIQMLQERYRLQYQRSEISYICGDVLDMSKLLLAMQQEQHSEDEQQQHEILVQEEINRPSSSSSSSFLLSSLVDCVYDKGLLDALLCGEGWNGPVASLLEQVGTVLQPGGSYILVSYPLPSSTKQFLMEQGAQWGLGQWNFGYYCDNDCNSDPQQQDSNSGTDENNNSIKNGMTFAPLRRVQIARAIRLE